VEPIRSESVFKLRRGQGRCFVKHAKRLNDSAIEEDPGGLTWIGVVVLGVAAKNLPGEGYGLRTRALPLGAALRNDCSGGLWDGCVAPRRELGK